MKPNRLIAVAGALLLSGASTAAAQARASGSPDPLNPMSTGTEVRQGDAVIAHPEFRAPSPYPSRGAELRAAPPPRPRNGRQTALENPGTSAVPGKLRDKALEPVWERAARRIPGVGTVKKIHDAYGYADPSPGDVLCLYTEPCGIFVDSMWPNQISTRQDIDSPATHRARRERRDIQKALEDPSDLPSYDGQCWPRAALESRLCEAERRVRESEEIDRRNAMMYRDAARYVDEAIAAGSSLMNDPNLSAGDRRMLGDLMNMLRQQQRDHQDRGILPSPPSPRTPAITPAPRMQNPTSPSGPRTLPQYGPSTPCYAAPGSACSNR